MRQKTRGRIGICILSARYNLRITHRTHRSPVDLQHPADSATTVRTDSIQLYSIWTYALRISRQTDTERPWTWVEFGRSAGLGLRHDFEARIADAKSHYGWF